MEEQSSSAKDLISRAQRTVPSISCEEYRLLRLQNVQHILLDVRERDEWDKGHIDGAFHIPRGFLEFKIEEAVPDKSTSIVVCCAKGGRAALAGETLRRIGYTNVRYLVGGYDKYCMAV
jgi:rhodanese-related sulfurtransferase